MIHLRPRSLRPRHFALLPFGLLLCCLGGELQAQTVTDIDGNVYTTVTIDGRVWMAENLATSHYQDGTAIPLVSNATSWFNQLTLGARCFFFNDSALVAPDYGTLYNWNAVNDARNVCPTGWHVPSDAEWNAMTTFLDPTVDPNWAGGTGTGTDIGNQLKEAGQAHWDVGNGGTNSSGFTARGAGYRTSAGAFNYLTAFTYFWTSTYGQQGKAWIRSLNFNDPTIHRFIVDRLYGASVRCIQDISTTVPEGPTPTGLKVYPNPATEAVQLAGLPPGAAQLRITDATGRVVRSVAVNGPTDRLHVEDLAPGVYLLTVGSVEGRSQAWLTVE